MPIYDSRCYQRCVQQGVSSQNWCYGCCNYADCNQGYYLSGCNNGTTQCTPCQPNCKRCQSPWTCGQCQESYCLTGGTQSYCVQCPPDCLQWRYFGGCVLWKAPQGCTNWESHYRICYQWTNSTNSSSETTNSNPPNQPTQFLPQNKQNSPLLIGLITPFSILLIIVMIFIIYKCKKRREAYQIPERPNTQSSISVNDCAICLISLGEGMVITTVCAHVFHVNCLREWRLRDGTCPMCRGPL